jgi:hypothetical protein
MKMRLPERLQRRGLVYAETAVPYEKGTVRRDD